jgi:hypothetical protein
MSRLLCCVDGCRHTMGFETALKRWGALPAEWMCGKHWGRLTKAERRVWARHERQHDKLGDFPRPVAAWRIWEGLKRRAAL